VNLGKCHKPPLQGRRILQGWIAYLLLTPIPIAVAAADGWIDPSKCVVDPWDHHNTVFVSPGSPPGASDVDRVTITVRDLDGLPLANRTVEIVLGGCTRLCRDPGDDGLVPTKTDANGVAVFQPKIGGCDECHVYVWVNGIEIRHYLHVRSTDWDGRISNGLVDPWDEPDLNDLCYDYNGDGSVGLDDLSLFSQAIGDSNPSACTSNPTGVDEEVTPGSSDLLGRPFPNPAGSQVWIPVRLSHDARLVVQVFDPAGRLVIVLFNGEKDAGRHELVWNLLSSPRAMASTGVYFIKGESEGQRSTRIVVVRR
jgi:hypothetical protein